MIPSLLSDWLARRLAQTPGSPIVAAISGGADSTALGRGLVDAAHGIGVDPGDVLVFAHFDHALRDRDAHLRDLEQVRRLADRCAVALYTEAAPARAIRSAATDHGGVESAARSARYDFLDRVCRAAGARTICTAHHADDQAETVLMRLLAGQTGTQLAGIPPERELASGVIVTRPLLRTRRAELLAYLRDRGESWSEDGSNRLLDHRRNQLRHEVLPAVQACWPAIHRDLCRLADGMRGLQAGAHAEARSVSLRWMGGAAVIPRSEFYGLSSEARLDLAYEVLGRLGAIRRDDRPGHRFLRPLQGEDPGGNRRLIGSRGVEVRLDARSVVFRRDIVRSGERRYLRGMAPGGC